MRRLLLVSVLSAIALSSAGASDWPQFRGESGSAVSGDANVPEHWDANANLIWKAKLPGPGASSPIVLGDRVYVTCYTGYGTNGEGPGDRKKLVRHLVCLDRKTGDVAWSSDVHTDSPEASYQGFMTQHGYASNTPATDGERIYVFLGTAGVYAFDLKGKEVWKHKVGTGTDRWGSASSVRLYDNLVIVNAAIESGEVVALHKENGHQAWKFSVDRQSWSTPALVETAAGKQELVVSSKGRISGLDPKSGKELWHCAGIDDYTCPSVTPGKGIAYVSGARQSAIIAVRCGGSGNVNDSHVLWRERMGANVSTPVLYDGRLYGVVDRGGVAYCLDAATGEVLFRGRLSTDDTPARPAAFQPGGRGGRRGGMGRRGGPGGPGGPGGFGGGPGGGGLSFYASPVAADGKIFVASRTSGVFVLAAKPTLEVLARNQFDSDNSPFDGTPAICDGQIFLRSNGNVYCVGAKN